MMARFYSDENFPFAVVLYLRNLRHHVLTTEESGLANQRTPDVAVLKYAVGDGRALPTMSRRHFIHLHQDHPEHFGIVV